MPAAGSIVYVIARGAMTGSRPSKMENAIKKSGRTIPIIGNPIKTINLARCAFQPQPPARLALNPMPVRAWTRESQ